MRWRSSYQAGREAAARGGRDGSAVTRRNVGWNKDLHAIRSCCASGSSSPSRGRSERPTAWDFDQPVNLDAPERLLVPRRPQSPTSSNILHNQPATSATTPAGVENLNSRILEHRPPSFRPCLSTLLTRNTRKPLFTTNRNTAREATHHHLPALTLRILAGSVARRQPPRRRPVCLGRSYPNSVSNSSGSAE